MKKTDNYQTSTGEMVTISRAEYEEFQGAVAKVPPKKKDHGTGESWFHGFLLCGII